MPSIIDELGLLREEALREVRTADSSDALEALRLKFLGKKGSISLALRGLGKVPAEERPAIGQVANDARDDIERSLADARARLDAAALAIELAAPAIDVTLPGRRGRLGHRHPVSRTLDDIVDALRRLGFSVADGPHVETDFYNFESLNFPKDHPARDMQDTFFVDPASLGFAAGRPDVLLRTHTSPVQTRAMLAKAGHPPVRVICPGTVFRCDSDPTHSPMFHQVECLYVDRGVTFADLKGTLEAFVRAIFGEGRQIRLRPSFFPFVEPGAEVDVSWATDKDGNVTKWLEILGAGMVHPNVLRASGIDPDVYSGFAFGLGVERVAMLRHGVDDLRLFFENDARFLEQF